jgi:DNA polymerase III subunit alpha
MSLLLYTQYTKPEGTIKFDDLVISAKRKGLKYLAMTDHGNFSGISEFYSKCIDSGIKPVIGMDFFCRLNNGKSVRIVTHIKNYSGYKNVLRIAGDLDIKGMIRSCSVDQLSGIKDIFITISCYKTDHLSESADIETDFRYIYSQLKTVNINPDDLFFNILYDESEYNSEVTAKLIDFQKESGIRLAASNPVYYLEESGHGIKSFALKLTEGDVPAPVCRNQFLGSTEKDSSRFSAESIEGLNFIVRSCSFRLEEMPVLFPDLKLKRKIDYSFFETLKQDALKIIPDQTEECRIIIREELAYIRKYNIADIFLFMKEVKAEFIEKYDLTLFFSGFVNDLHLAYLFNLTLSSPVFAVRDYHRAVLSEKKLHPQISVLVAPESRENLFAYLSERFSDENVCFLSEYVKWHFPTVLGMLEKHYGIEKNASETLNQLHTKFSRSAEKNKEITESREFTELRKKYPEISELTEYLLLLDDSFRNFSINTNQMVISNEKISRILPVAKAETNSGIKSSFLNMNTAKYFGVWTINIESYNYLNIRKYFRLGPIKETNLDITAAELISRIKKDDLGMIPYFSFSRQRESFLSLSDKPVCNLVLYNEAARNNLSSIINRPSPEHPKKWYKKELAITRGFIVFKEQLYFICDKLFRSKDLNYLRRRLLESSGTIQFNSILNQISERNEFREKCEYLRNAVQPTVFYLSLSECLMKVVIAIRTLELKINRKKDLMEFVFAREADQNGDWRRYIPEMISEGYLFRKFSVGCVNEKTLIKDEEIFLPLHCIRGISAKISDSIYRFVSSIKIDSFQDFLEKSDKEIIRHNIVEMLIKVGFFDLFNPNRKELEILNDKYFSSIKKEITDQPGLFETEEIEIGSVNSAQDYTAEQKQDIEDKLTGLVFTKKTGSECELCGLLKTSDPAEIITDCTVYIKNDFELHLSVETSDDEILKNLFSMLSDAGNCEIEIFFSDTKESLTLSKYIQLDDMAVYRLKRLLNNAPFYFKIKEKKDR